MKRILDVIGEYDCILCPTFEEALSFCRIAHEQGLVWCDGRSYIEYTQWEEYNDKTVYFPQRGQFGSEKTQQAYINVIFFSKFKERLKENKSMKRILDVMKRDECVSCPTLNEAREYCNIAHEQGLTWCTGDSYNGCTQWEEYECATVYYPIRGIYGSAINKKPYVKIISLNEFKERLKLNNMNKEMKIEIPKGYEFDCIEDGVIKFKEAKKELPKTYEECISLLIKKECLHEAVSTDAMNAFLKLLIIREAYRDGWKPDWTDFKTKYNICVDGGNLYKSVCSNVSCVLSFQTREARDEFYENFKDLIEEAKEFI